jgi:DNA-binding NarL/FixJ family response regulator
MTPYKPGVVLVDDHILLRNGLANLIRSFNRYDVLFEACGGKDLIRQLKNYRRPDIILLDINMPDMDGYETAWWLTRHYPDMKVLALSMYDSDSAIIRMLKNGAKGYITKDTHPAELRLALDSVIEKGFYYSEMVTGKLIHTIGHIDETDHRARTLHSLNERELEFMKLVCTEWTYKEIADRMYLSPRTIDGYRDALFEKLNVKTRVGLAMYAVRNGIVNLDAIEKLSREWQTKPASEIATETH